MLALKPARELIVRQIKATWCPAETDVVSIGAQRVAVETYPQATIITGPEIERDYSHGARVVREDYRLFIEGRFEIPSDGTIDDLQVEKAHELGFLLVGDMDTPAAADWASAGCYWPKIVNVTLPAAAPDEPFYSVVLVLELSSDVNQ